MTLKSWTASQTATWKKQGKTFITRFVFLPMIFIVHVVWLALVLCVLVPWLALDFLPKRRPRPLKTSSQIPQKPRLPYHNRPHLCRDGSSIFWEMPDGEIIPVEPLQASLILQEVASVVAGALVYEKTKLPR
jgi:hypothetical protein